MDWVVYLEHLQFILKEFDPSIVSNEKTFIKYFWNRLRSSIRVQLDKCSCYLDTWKKLIKKAIDIEAKTTQ